MNFQTSVDMAPREVLGRRMMVRNGMPGCHLSDYIYFKDLFLFFIYFFA